MYVCVIRRNVLEWLDGEIEDVCLNSQEIEEVTQRGVDTQEPVIGEV